MKTAGQIAYETDCERAPRYHDATPRKAWERIWHSPASEMELGTKPNAARLSKPPNPYLRLILP